MALQNYSADCLTAFEVVFGGFGQIVRIGFLSLLLLQFLVFLQLAWEYKRKRLILHGNLKLLYVNLVILYQFSPFGYFLAEIRHLVLAIFFPSSPCSMLTPFWYILLSRGTISIYNFSIPLLHFAIMLERLRATKLANRYEFEGPQFAIALAIIVYIPVLGVTATTGFMVFVDINFQFDNLLPVNSLTTKSSNLPVQIFTYFLIFVVILTAFGDYFVFRLNKSRMKDISNRMASAAYNLSEKYQLLENGRAMRMILPLDVAYMFSYLLYSFLVVLIRANQPPNLDYSAYLAQYNLIASILTLYTIVSLAFYRRFLLQNEPGRRKGPKRHLMGATAEVMPLEMVGHLYFQQLKAQWNYVPIKK